MSGWILITVVLQAVLFGVGTLMYLFACLIYGSVWPIFPLLLWILIAMGIVLFAPSRGKQWADPEMDDGTSEDVKWFVLSAVITAAFCLPLSMARWFVIPKGAAYMCLSGSFLYALTAMIAIKASLPSKSELNL